MLSAIEPCEFEYQPLDNKLVELFLFRSKGNMAAWRELRETMQGMAQAMQQMAQGQMALGQMTQTRNGAGNLHRSFRGMNPPRFAGTTDPDEAEDWI